MLDIALIRRDPDRVRHALVRRGLDASVIDELLRFDEEYRSALTTVERIKAEKNRLSAAIGKAPDKGAAARELQPKIAELTKSISESEERARGLSPAEQGSPLRALLDNLPNLLDDSVPDGASEAANVEVRRWGEPRRFDFAPKPHWELGERLGILDFARAAKLSGSRFAALTGAGAQLARGLTAFFLDRAAARGYAEVAPPLLVSRETMWSTGQLSKFADAMFADAQADLFLIPTAEVPLTAFRSGEILDAAELPCKYAAATPCFRKEAGAAGKDTRGLMRQHQFDKVELVWLSRPEASHEALETLTEDARSLLEELELPHRVVTLCAGDTSFNAAKTHDVEVWIPSSDTYREISSCSNCTDFQARRAAIRFRREAASKPELVHTLNGSGLAIGRTLIALLENNQRADGSIVLPKALEPYVPTTRLG
ncbi:MAG: serine--tRNA ligase [Candidatus Eremiobacteraeota bacterium]|nr:serine--tRNA ligase [Candidatus Eremiobacteraeota bacterium]MBV8498424.1 serine--tRNA ligase [Candidatus Eremiobacteraeota bacterium]